MRHKAAGTVTVLPDGEPRTVTTSDGVELYAEVGGAQDAPATVVFAHGWTLSSRSWAEEAAALGETARTVVYDQRGHGRSGWRSGYVPSIDQLGADLYAVLDQLVPDGPVVLVGHSMGGMTIMALAADHPELFGDRVTGVALVATSAGRLGEVTLGLPSRASHVTRRVLPRLMAAAERWGACADLARRLLPPRRRLVQRQVQWLLFGPAAPAAAVAACAELIHATPARTIGAFYPALLRHDKHAALEPIRKVPVLILAGELDRLTPVSHSHALAAALPDARLVVVPGCGHMLPMECPETVTKHLRELLPADS
ncbi:alpha/beta hydrolase [Carbonactinospora thermoautotrophica]|uniref:alpha/beta fold hydrolase n=1 Tax=Carbonactinospora thermoautotrophica TaxID=1469144 RepID=UPI002270CB2E|nr:alpha/beta hydrolase [Carbonactinospora thermoautotrophica]MCX9192657.1 alpha/beta hydrolase [Carbonactinospora thermoautotrophica]